MTPLGIFVGLTLHDSLSSQTASLFTAGFNAFAAGSFLYMSTLHHLNHHTHKHKAETLREAGALLIGLIMMAGLSYFD